MKKGTAITSVIAGALAIANVQLAAQDAGSSQQQRSQSAQQSGYSSTAQTTSSAQHTQATPRNSRAKDVLNASVKSQDGQDLGSIEDLIIDSSSGRIQFVVLGQGGMLGMGGDLIPVPWSSIKVQQDPQRSDRREVTINVSRQKLQSAPALQRDYSNLNDPSFSRLVNQFYGAPASGVGGAESPGGAEQGVSIGSEHQGASDLSATNNWNSTTTTNQ